MSISKAETSLISVLLRLSEHPSDLERSLYQKLAECFPDGTFKIQTYDLGDGCPYNQLRFSHIAQQETWDKPVSITWKLECNKDVLRADVLSFGFVGGARFSFSYEYNTRIYAFKASNPVIRTVDDFIQSFNICLNGMHEAAVLEQIRHEKDQVQIDIRKDQRDNVRSELIKELITSTTTKSECEVIAALAAITKSKKQIQKALAVIAPLLK